MQMLEISDLYKAYDGKPVLDGVSLTVSQGEVIAVIGPSGSGKSTLLRCLNRLEIPDAGRIVVEGETMMETKDGHVVYAPDKQLHRIRLKMGMVFQQFNLFPHFSVLRNLTQAQCTVLRTPPQQAKEKALALLAQVGLADRADAYPCQLSGGQQQRVAIARALAMDPDILCFDEPTSALDPELTLEVLSVMKDLAREHRTMLVVTHEMGFAREAADRVVMIDDGHVIEQGAPADFFTRPQTDRAIQFLGQWGL